MAPKKKKRAPKAAAAPVDLQAMKAALAAQAQAPKSAKKAPPKKSAPRRGARGK